MNIDIGLSETNRDAAITALKTVLGETYALYSKTHGYHWNVTGPNFQALHDMFMTQYTDLWEALDTIAERIRALGAFAPGSASEILDAASIRPDNGVPDAATMVSNLARGHETLAKAIRDAIASAEQAGDDVTVDLLIQRATIADKTAWMLRASL